MQKMIEVTNQIHVAKKCKLCSHFKSQFFLGNLCIYHKSNLIQEAFLEDLVLYIAGGYWPLENPWLKQLVLHQCGHVQFPFQWQLVNELLLNIVDQKKTEICFYLLLHHVLHA